MSSEQIQGDFDMKKRFIFTLILLVLTAITISGCGASKESSETSTASPLLSNYLFFETENSEQYLNFLKELDSSTTYELVGISNCSYLKGYDSITVYTVTYKVCDEKEPNHQYEYSLFETENKYEYLSFLDALSDEYEIVDISYGSYSFEIAGPFSTFIITYRKQL